MIDSQVQRYSWVILIVGKTKERVLQGQQDNRPRSSSQGFTKTKERVLRGQQDNRPKNRSQGFTKNVKSQIYLTSEKGMNLRTTKSNYLGLK